jgi:hypothetical protein
MHRSEASTQIPGFYTNLKLMHRFEASAQIRGSYTNPKLIHRSEASTQIRGSYTNPKLLYRITDLITRSTMATTTAKLIQKEQFDDLLPPPRAPSWCVAVARVVENHVIGVHKAQPWQVEYIQGFLSERYLLSLPRLSEDKRAGIDTSPDHLR